jgi:hypothetical protein
LPVPSLQSPMLSQPFTSTFDLDSRPTLVVHLTHCHSFYQGRILPVRKSSQFTQRIEPIVAWQEVQDFLFLG